VRPGACREASRTRRSHQNEVRDAGRAVGLDQLVEVGRCLVRQGVSDEHDLHGARPEAGRVAGTAPEQLVKRKTTAMVITHLRRSHPMPPRQPCLQFTMGKEHADRVIRLCGGCRLWGLNVEELISALRLIVDPPRNDRVEGLPEGRAGQGPWGPTTPGCMFGLLADSKRAPRKPLNGATAAHRISSVRDKYSSQRA